MKRVIIIALAMVSLCSYGQNQQSKLMIEYEAYINSVLEKIEVITDWEKSSSISKKAIQSNGQIYPVLFFQDVFKNYKQNYLIYDDDMSKYPIKENLNQFNWKITNKKDTLMGYSCTKAVCNCLTSNAAI